MKATLSSVTIEKKLDLTTFLLIRKVNFNSNGWKFQRLRYKIGIKNETHKHKDAVNQRTTCVCGGKLSSNTEKSCNS